MGCLPIANIPYHEFGEALHNQAVAARIPINGSLELTYRCNLRCVHCYCNLPAHDRRIRAQELSLREVVDCIDQAAEAGCLWLLITGGECLLRPDFTEIWKHAKKSGLLLTLFTNGTLISPRLADFLEDWPPYSVEISLYGIRPETYDKVTGTSGALARCQKGIGLLLERRLPLRLKSMALTLNVHELAAMKQYARSLGIGFRFDTKVNSRLDRGQAPCSYRIDPAEAARLEVEDEERLAAWQEFLGKFSHPGRQEQLFGCGAGVTAFNIDPYGRLQVCGMVKEPSWDLRKGSFRDGWDALFAGVVQQQPTAAFTCSSCEFHALCSHCPGWAFTENSDLETPVDYLCQATRALAQALRNVGAGFPRPYIARNDDQGRKIKRCR